MIRVVHVLESEADFQTHRCVHDLVRHLGAGFVSEVATIGRGGTWRHMAAAFLGVRVRKDVDVLHAWGGKALAACVGSAASIVHSPPAAPGERSIGWLRAAMGYRPVRIVCPTDSMRKMLATRGIDPQNMRLIRPAVDFSRLRKKKDAELRAALGFAKEDIVLLGVGESTDEARHKDALWAAGILHVYDPRYRLLLWGRGPAADAVERFNQRLGHPQLLCMAQRRLGKSVEYEDLFAVADLALVTSSGPVAPLPICMAMAAGVPIVSTVTATSSELLEDRHTAVMLRPGFPREMAQRVLRLREDASLQWKLADRARAEAYDYFSMARFAREYGEVYRGERMKAEG